MEVFHLVTGVARQSERNPQGVAAEGHYIVRGGAVILTDAEGNRTSRRAALNGQDHRTIAARLIKHRWQDEYGENDFNRTLSHRDYEWQCPC